MKKIPVVDIGECNLCGGCIEISPDIFRINNNAGYVEVIDMDEYPQDEVDEAIKNCPQNCIYWE